MKNIRYIVLIAIAAVCMLSTQSCSNSARRNRGERIISVTIEPQRYFAEAIGGDKFTIKSMVPKGSSPETYDPTPQQLVALSESEAYLRIGYIGFEQTWMDRMLSNAPHLKVFDLSEGIELIHEGKQAHGDHFHEGGVEPHVWSSVVNAKIIAGNTLRAFCQLDAANEEFFRARYDSIMVFLEETDTLLTRMLASGGDRSFMIYHPALSYFARDYGLRQIPIEVHGKEPSMSYLKSLIEVAEAEQVRTIFVQPEFDKRGAEFIAEQAQTKVVEINPLAYDWQAEMIHVAKSLSHEE